MTTQDLAKYLRLHPISICKFAGEGKIPGVRIGRLWRFDKKVIDKWITGGQPEISDQIQRTIIQKKSRKKRASRRKGCSTVNRTAVMGNLQFCHGCPSDPSSPGDVRGIGP
jgi:excisionase family DNA binding protein